MILNFLTDSGWVQVILVVLLPAVGWAGRWLWERWKKARGPFIPRTEGDEDRAAYAWLLQDYESNLKRLEQLIRAKFRRGADEWNADLEQQWTETRDKAYRNLEKPLGIFENLDILEERNVGMTEARNKRAELQARQADIESHALFIKRGSVARVDSAGL